MADKRIDISWYTMVTEYRHVNLSASEALQKFGTTDLKEIERKLREDADLMGVYEAVRSADMLEVEDRKVIEVLHES